VLVNTSLIAPLPLPRGWLMPDTTARVQENVVLPVALAGVYPNVVPLQIATGVSVLVNTGVGFTVIVKLPVAPTHPL
jgi:hypothetical protein